MQGEARGETRDRFQPVAVQQRGMMVAGLDDDEEIQRVLDLEHRLVRKFFIGLQMPHVRGAHLGQVPARHFRQGLVDQRGQARNLLRRELVPERRHLGGGAAITNDRIRLPVFQAPQVLRQQRRADAAEAVGAMAGGAVFGKELGNGWSIIRRDVERRDKT